MFFELLMQLTCAQVCKLEPKYKRPMQGEQQGSSNGHFLN